MKVRVQSYLAEFNDRSRDLAMERDSINLAHAGVENGRNIGHLAALNSDALPINKRDKDSGDHALDIILATLPYDQLLADTVTRLRDVQNLVDRAVEIAIQRFNNEAASREQLESMAAKLPDGTKVAMDENGNVRTLDGVIVDPERAAQVEFTPNNPSYEKIAEQQDRANDALDVLNQVRKDELKLGELSEELENEPSRKRINGINDEIEAIEERNEAIIENTNDNTHSQNKIMTVETSNSFSVPDLQ